MTTLMYVPHERTCGIERAWLVNSKWLTNCINFTQEYMRCKKVLACISWQCVLMGMFISAEITSGSWTCQLLFQLWILLPFPHRKHKIFHDFPWPPPKFHDFPGLESEIIKFHDFPGFPWPVRTLCSEMSKFSQSGQSSVLFYYN